MKRTFLGLTAVLIALLGNTQNTNALPQPVIGFEPNKGQFSDESGKPVPDVLFALKNQATDVWVTTKGLVYINKFYNKNRSKKQKTEKPDIGEYEFSRTDVELEGVDLSKVKTVCLGENTATKNYYTHRYPTGLENIHTYDKIVFEEVYPLIDFVVEHNHEGIKYNFIVHEGAQPDQIKLLYKWADVFLEKNGDLRIANRKTSFVEKAPYVYDANSHEEIASHFRVQKIARAKNRIQFELEKNHAREIVIDPLQLVWGTYFNVTYINSTTTDSLNNYYITGSIGTTTLPTYNPGGGAYFDGSLGGTGDCFISKFNQNNTLVWSTYLGGSSNDYSLDIDLKKGSIVICGKTQSTAFPCINSGSGAYFDNTFNSPEDDMFLSKFNLNGHMTWSTYYGNEDISAASIKMDQQGNIYLTGSTNALPALVNMGGSAFYDGTLDTEGDSYISKFNALNQLQHSTYLGGNSADKAFGMSIDKNGDIYIVGYTASTNFPTYDNGFAFYDSTHGASYWDIFITKLNGNMELLWSTYMGGEADETNPAIIALNNGDIVVSGYSSSPDFPLLDPGGDAYFQSSYSGDGDVFFQRFDQNGVLKWSTFQGNSIMGDCLGLAKDSNDNLYMARFVYISPIDLGIDIHNGAFYQPKVAPYTMNILMLLSPDNQFKWTTYGFSNMAVNTTKGYLSSNTLGEIYWINNSSPDYSGAGQIVYNPGSPAYFNGSYCRALIYKFSACSEIMNVTSLSGPDTIATGSNALFIASPDSSGIDYGWILPSGWGQDTTFKDSINVFSKCYSGNVCVTVPGCMNSDTVCKHISVIPPAYPLISNLSTQNILCNSDSTGQISFIPVSGTPPYTATWSNGLSGNSANGLSAGTYQIYLSDSLGCIDTASVTLTQPLPIQINIDSTLNVSCHGDSTGGIFITVTGGISPFQFDWNDDGTGDMDDTEDLTGLPANNYFVTVLDQNNCLAYDTVEISQPDSLFITATVQNVSGGINNGAINITVNGGSPTYTYDWPSLTSASEDVSGLGIGTYTVIVTDQNYCLDSASFVIDYTLSIEAYSKSNGLQIIWNEPNLLIKNIYASSDVRIFDISGRIVYTDIFSSDTTIPMTFLAPGEYIVHINNGALKIGRFVKSR